MTARRRRRRPHRTARRGFTLVEAVATIVVLAVIGTVSSGIVMNATGGYLEASEGAQLHAEASIALDRIVRELRSMSLDDAASSIAPDIESMSATAITWDDDDTLALSGTDLLLTEDGGAATLLLGDVSSFALTAHDESDATIALPITGAGCDAVRRVTIELTLTRNGVSESLRAKLFLRCTMAGAGS